MLSVKVIHILACFALCVDAYKHDSRNREGMRDSGRHPKLVQRPGNLEADDKRVIVTFWGDT